MVLLHSTQSKNRLLRLINSLQVVAVAGEPQALHTVRRAVGKALTHHLHVHAVYVNVRVRDVAAHRQRVQLGAVRLRAANHGLLRVSGELSPLGEVVLEALHKGEGALILVQRGSRAVLLATGILCAVDKAGQVAAVSPDKAIHRIGHRQQVGHQQAHEHGRTVVAGSVVL